MGDWYKTILYAPENSLEKPGYKKGDTPVAEKVSKQIINLPTGINVYTEFANKLMEIYDDL